MAHDDKNSIRSPLGRARGLGSAKDGVHHWWMQRVTSIALIPLSLFFLWHLDNLAEPSYAAVIHFFKHPTVAIAGILFIAVSFYHAMLGVQVIIEDYQHSESYKLICILLNKMVFTFLGFACIFAICYINFALQG
ncbi:MAG TPA: succinate dehydrogenase, hydrophobic membrane anchor protein [Patescibacteria group bacterium]|nr:succinate dehydrogenase, hydrophobic membrane anchor protein [Patescibacteria group bacterium]